MLRWKRYSGISPERLLMLTFCGPVTDPLATANGGAALDDGDVAGFPAVRAH